MVSLIGGVAALVLGIVFLYIWRIDFLVVLKGTLPALFIMGGALAAYLGMEELKDKTSSDSIDDDTASLKNEVENLKEEIRELKGEKKTEE